MKFTNRCIIITKSNNRTHIKVCTLKHSFISGRMLYFDTTNDHDIVIPLKDLVCIKSFRPDIIQYLGSTIKHYM